MSAKAGLPASRSTPRSSYSSLEQALVFSQAVRHDHDGEVTLVHDDGTVTVRLHGYDVPVTTRGERLAEIPDLSTASALGNRDSMLGFRHIDTDVKNVILRHGPAFFAWGSARHSRANPVAKQLQKLTAGRRSDHGHNV
ncbi:hypothetical protein [Mesorhizobium sp.]|uniref:hypothetical protein n=1 Tax=Mesorhizobium sp. TaxID=1871066 RepID=UPI00257E7901|nr:hypothetical protein [Mesorhizobium sp.]